MFCKASRGRLPLAILALALLGCSRQPGGKPFQRIAILRFENLGANPALDWMGRAFSEVMASELAGAPGIYAIPANRMHSYESALGRGRSPARHLRRARAGFRIRRQPAGLRDYSVRGGKLRPMVIEDAGSGKMKAELSASAPADGVIAAASDLARQIWSAAQPRRPADTMGLRHTWRPSKATMPAAAERNLEQASPPARIRARLRLLGQLKARAQDRSGALAVLSQALSPAFGLSIGPAWNSTPPKSRGDRLARLRALDALSKLDPSDPTVWQGLAEAAMRAHRYPQARRLQKGSNRAGERNTLNQLAMPAAMQAIFRLPWMPFAATRRCGPPRPTLWTRWAT